MPYVQYLFCCVMILTSTVFGAPAQHRYGKSFSQDYSEIEQLLIKEDQFELANLARELRLKNPYPKGSDQYQIWWEQSQFNVPILILSSLFLDTMCQRENIKTILFSQRDCYHWIKIFKKLFPNYRSIDFMTSRFVYYNPTLEYIQYVRSFCQDKFIVVDVNGSGKSCLTFFRAHFHFTPLHLAIVRETTLLPGIIHENLLPDSYHNIEPVNFAPFGRLRSFNAAGAVRFPLEYSIDLIAPAIKCVDHAIELLDANHSRVFDQRAINILLKALYEYSPVLTPYLIGT